MGYPGCTCPKRTNLRQITAPPADSIDLSAQDFWQRPAEERDAAFAVLRRERPLSWQRPPESVLMPADPDDRGYWAAVRYADVRTVSRDPKTFRSGEGVMFEDVEPELLEASLSFLATGRPAPHQAARPRERRLHAAPDGTHRGDDPRAWPARRVDELVETGDCDFVEHVSRRLPMTTIAELMGVAGGRPRDA